jgi:HupE / UreJ protein
MRRVWLALLIGVVCVSRPAWAHPLAPSLLQVAEDAAGLTFVRWKRPLTVPDALQPVLPASCTALGPAVTRTDTVARIAEMTLSCPAGIVGEQFVIDGLRDSRTDVLLRFALRDGRVLHHVLRPGAGGFRVPERPGRFEVSLSYLQLGLEHIGGGFDHLLFLLGLLALAPGGRALAGMVTAFTVGHGLTLSIAAVGGVPLPAAAIEVLIALTIVVLAYELTRGTAPEVTLLGRHPAALTFGFGLLHGLGFAGALREAGLPTGEVVLALIGFNAGIEAGQLAFVLASVLLHSLVRARWPVRGWGRVGLAYVVGSVAACLVLERAAVWIG